MLPGFSNRRRFSDLSEQEVLALAISSEEEDGRIYATYAERLREQYPRTASVFEDMAAEEDEHRRRLIDLYRERFGETIPLIRREHVAGFVDSRKNVIRTELLQARATGHAIVDEAIDQNADVIILGAKLQRRHGRLTVGETIDHVLHHAPCEVVVLRNKMPDWLIDALEIDYE